MHIGVIHKNDSGVSTTRHHLLPSRYEVTEFHLRTFIELVTLPDTIDALIFETISSANIESDKNIVRRLQDLTPAPLLLMTKEDGSAEYRSALLDSGIDGCLVVPFQSEELELRLQKLVHIRGPRRFRGTELTVGDITLNFQTHRITRSESEINVTPTEYGLLEQLMVSAGTFVSVGTLYQYLNQSTQNSASLHVHILNLRRKLGEPECIKTIPNYGYILGN